MATGTLKEKGLLLGVEELCTVAAGVGWGSAEGAGANKDGVAPKRDGGLCSAGCDVTLPDPGVEDGALPKPPKIGGGATFPLIGGGANEKGDGTFVCSAGVASGGDSVFDCGANEKGEGAFVCSAAVASGGDNLLGLSTGGADG